MLERFPSRSRSLPRYRSGASWRKGVPRLRFQTLVYLIGGMGAFCMLSYYILLQWMFASTPPTQLRLPPGQSLPSKRFCAMRKPPMVCAHGGDTTNAPANTMQSFQNAINAKVECVEVDVARTKDSELVVLHVRELRQLLGSTTDADVQVGDLLWQDIAALQWPSGERVMKVRDAIMMTSPHVSCVTLDIKTYFDKAGNPTDEQALSDAVVKMVYHTGCSNCLVWAKSDAVVKEVKKLSPAQRVGLVVMNETAEARRLHMDKPYRIPGAEVVAAHHVMVDGELTDSLHHSGRQLFSWTVNDEAALVKVLDAAVDGVVTNYPRMLQAAIESRLSDCEGTRRGG